MTPETLRSRALALHRAGRLAEAERLYAELLRHDPADFEVLHRQGAIAQQAGRYREAVELIGRSIELRKSAGAYLSLGSALMGLRRAADALAAFETALSLRPNLASALSASAVALRELSRSGEAYARASAALALEPSAQACCVQGTALTDLGRFAEAIASFDRALELQPQCVEAYDYRGIALQRLRRDAEALASFDSALALRPSAAELHNNRGNVLRHLRRFDEALASYDRAIALKPDFAAAYNNRGLALQALERYREAAGSYQHALELQPDFAEACNNLGTALCELGRPAEALASCQRALELKPGMPGVHANIGSALRDLQRPEEALAQYELALREAPAEADNHCHRGNALFDLKLLPQAIASYERAIELAPAHARAHFNKGLCLLLSGNLAQGLPLYEWRRELPGASRSLPAGPSWRGAEELGGKTLFIYADQALGDTVQFCRYAKLAAERGARVVLAVQPQLRELLGGLSPDIRVIAQAEDPGRYDYHCALASLPLAFATTLADVPAAVPYLYADPQRAARWHEHIGDAGFRIGITWQGSRNRIDVGRSVPLEFFVPLAGIPGVRLISLQKGEAVEQLRGSRPAPLELLGDDFDAGPQAFLDSAAVMSHLDLLITCDTALAHLAGALGRPTWVALKQVPDWRWLLDREDSPWYPSMRLFRQSQRGDWDGVFAVIHDRLARLTRAAHAGAR